MSRLNMTLPDGREIELTPDNTTVMFFGTVDEDELDHVQLVVDGTAYLNYQPEFRAACVNEELPILWRHDRPEWAVERRMNIMEVDDLDMLLGGE